MNNAVLRAIITAFAFLTLIPMPILKNYRPIDSSRALAVFPLVGIFIGYLLWLIAQLDLATPILAAIILCVWILITGGLHLDGLGDSADGWLGGLGDRERSLAIMKDPHAGSAAVISIGCILILKFAAISTLLAQQQYLALLFTPLIGRCIPAFLFLSTPYVSPNGIAKDFIEHASTATISTILFITVLGFMVGLGLSSALFTLLVLAIALGGLRALMMRRLGGNTGDTTGASIEIIEALCLLTLASV